MYCALFTTCITEDGAELLGLVIWNSFYKYYIPFVETKDFKIITDNKPFLDKPVKSKQEAMRNLLKWQETMIMQKETY